MLYFGGLMSDVGVDSDDLWALDLTAGSETWNQLSPSGTGPRDGIGTAAFDTHNNRLVLFLGSRGGTWVADFSTPGGTWHALDAPVPQSIGSGPIVYHAPTQRALMVVSAGAGKTEVWSLDLRRDMEAWSKLAPCGSAPLGQSVSEFRAALDESNDRLMVTRIGPGQHNVWTLSLEPGSECWGLLSPDGDRPRDLGAMVYDACPSRRRMLFFGDVDSNATVALNLPADRGPSFEYVDVSGQAPSIRSGHALVMDRIGQRLIVAYGRGIRVPTLTDVWALELGPCSAPTQTPAATHTPIPADTPTRPAATDVPSPTAAQPEPSVTPSPPPASLTPTDLGTPTGAPRATATPTPTARPSEGPPTVTPTPDGRSTVFLPFAAAAYDAAAPNGQP